MIRGGGDGTSNGVGVDGDFARPAPHPPETSATRTAVKKRRRTVLAIMTGIAAAGMPPPTRPFRYGAFGSEMRKVVPRPSVDWTSMSPSCSCTVRYTIDNPTPLPCSRVVK